MLRLMGAVGRSLELRCPGGGPQHARPSVAVGTEASQRSIVRYELGRVQSSIEVSKEALRAGVLPSMVESRCFLR